MQLKVRRSQRVAGAHTIFALDVVADLTLEERAMVERYKLWNEVVYSNDSAAANAERAKAGNLKALGTLLVDKMLKRLFTVKNLVSGEHIECQNLEELLGAEQQVREACANLKKYLDIATSFDGREEVVEVASAA